MSTFFYGDLLRDYDKRTTKHFYEGIPLYLKLKSMPSAKTNLALSYKLSRFVERQDDVETV